MDVQTSGLQHADSSRDTSSRSLCAGFAFSARGQLPASPRVSQPHTGKGGRRRKFENASARSETHSGGKKIPKQVSQLNLDICCREQTFKCTGKEVQS